ncbi:MAG: sugar phosphate isomerase/epimerase [Verrucomicrobiales bacterium]|nr:sugar phosphate isomerase/epimerase [Verrucomicrobiales bacterium]
MNATPPLTSAAQTRRDWLALGVMTLAGAALPSSLRADARPIRFGLVTYQWAKDWDLPTLLKNCGPAGVEGVELRTTHRHGVEPELTAAQRAEVKKRFADSGVVCLGPGSDERFDSPDPATLKKAIERTKAFLQLSHDIGSSGVKVKPDRFHEGVPQEKTIAQVAAALREVAEFAKNLGQEVRLEIHGQLAAPETIVKVMQACDHPQARLCWNCNDPDVDSGGGFDANFALARPWFGQTVHVHDLDGAFRPYPYDRLVDLLKKTGYQGWCLLESSTNQTDPVAAYRRQRELFDALLARPAAA